MPGVPRAASGGVGKGGTGSDGGAPGDKKNGKENGKGKIAKRQWAKRMKILAQENMKAVTRIFCPVFAKQHLYEPGLASWHQDGQGTLCDDDNDEDEEVGV